MLTRFLIQACLAFSLVWGAFVPAAIAAEAAPSAFAKSATHKAISFAASRVPSDVVGGLCLGNGYRCSGNGPSGACCAGYCIQGTCNSCVPGTGSGC